MRRVSKFAAAAAAVSMMVAVGCTVPTGGEPGDPRACAAGPLDLGVADSVVASSSDGSTFVLADFPDEGGERVVYSKVDVASGHRSEILRTPLGDGAGIDLDAAGHRALVQLYPVGPPWESTWALLDLRTGSNEPLPVALENDIQLIGVSSDLSTLLVWPYTQATQPARRVDVATGSSTPVGLVPDAAWWIADASPDLSLVVEQSALVSGSMQLRLRDVASGAVVRNLGAHRLETGSSPDVSFVDDTTLLVSGALPTGSAPGAAAGDGAYVLDIESNTVTRVDPGIANARTRSASPDGTRSLYRTRTGTTSALIDGNHVALGAPLPILADVDHDVAVGIEGDRARLHCL